MPATPPRTPPITAPPSCFPPEDAHLKIDDRGLAAAAGVAVWALVVFRAELRRFGSHVAACAAVVLALSVVLGVAAGEGVALAVGEPVTLGVAVCDGVALAVSDVLPVLEGEAPLVREAVGEALTVLPETAEPVAQAWDAVLNRWETDLIIMADPEPGSESAWLALKPATGNGLPIMLHKLPFWPHPQRKTANGDPF